MIRVGIIGGAGYTAGELIRLLLNHPEAKIVWVNSSSNAGNRLDSVHGGIAGDTDMTFTDSHPLDEVDVIFLCSGHGKSSEFWSLNEMPEGLKVIDLAQDYRDEPDGYVYGLPELNRDRIRQASKIANPGCFATSIQLALLPLAKAGRLPQEICVTGITGSTGAGVKPGATTHFSWRTDNLSVYKVFTHQHLIEIGMNMRKLQPGFDGKINFIPVRGDFARGIFTMVNMPCDMTETEVRSLFDGYYHGEPFVRVASGSIDLKQAVNTNKAMLQLVVNDGRLMVACAIDNLLKGASGQAVENMNLIFGLPEDMGLRLKASAF